VKNIFGSLLITLAFTVHLAQGAVIIDTVTVGNSGNAAHFASRAYASCRVGLNNRLPEVRDIAYRGGG
jgi:phosphoribosylcarboxyaminoimidazole (NCAIR) mutase